MALSGGHTGTAVGGLSLRIDWSATQNISNNTSTITAKAYVVIASNWAINIGSRTGVITIDGTDTTITYNLGYKGAGTHHIGTASKTITHNNTTGEKSFAISGSAKIEASISGFGWIGTLSKGSNTYTLDTIPRTSTFTIPSSFNVGSAFTVSITRASSSFTHWVEVYDGSTRLYSSENTVGTSVSPNIAADTLLARMSGVKSKTFTVRVDTYNGNSRIGGTSKTITANIPTSTFTIPGSFTMGEAFTATISRVGSLTHAVELWDGSTNIYASGNNVTTSGSVNVALSTLAARSPNSMSRTFRLDVDTYNGNLFIGKSSKNITGNVPSTAKPTFSAVTVSENVSAVNTLVGAYVQTKSRLNLAITGASGIYGSTIRSYNITGVGHNANSSSTVTGYLSVSGNQTIKGTVTDSRGQTFERSVVINILPYAAPTLSDLSFRRTLPDKTEAPLGDNVTVMANVKVQSLIVNGVEKNSIIYHVQSAQSGGSFADKADTTSTSLTENYSDVWSGYSVDYSYNFRVRAGDVFGFGGWSVGVVPTGIVTQQWGSKTTSFGKMIDDTSYNVQVGTGGIQSDGPIVGSDGLVHSNGYTDTRSVNNTPEWYQTNKKRQIVREFKSKSTIGLSSAVGNYIDLSTHVFYSDPSGGPVKQVAIDDGGNIYTRTGAGGGTSWSSWVKVNVATVNPYPVGSIYISVSNTNPSSLFGGTWAAFGTGRTLVGVDTGQTEFNTVQKTGGHKSLQAHTHTVSGTATSAGAHTHPIKVYYSTAHGANGVWGSNATGSSYTANYATSSGAHTHPVSGTAASTGGGNAQNLQPYITVYMWRRTA